VRAKSKLYLAAEQSYRKALELNPKSEAVLLDLALVYELEGKTEEAIQIINACCRSIQKCMGAEALGRTVCRPE
jgi:tetratricopeptide (TPR) repeat protein